MIAKIHKAEVISEAEVINEAITTFAFIFEKHFVASEYSLDTNAVFLSLQSLTTPLTSHLELAIRRSLHVIIDRAISASY